MKPNKKKRKYRDWWLGRSGIINTEKCMVCLKKYDCAGYKYMRVS